MVNQIIYSKKFSYLIILIIPFLITGPFFPDLILSLSSLIFIYYVIQNREKRFFANKPLIIFFIFCFYCIFSSFLSADYLHSLKSSFFYFRIGIFACLIWFLIENDKKILDYFYYIIFISFLILILDSFFQYIFKKNVLGFPILGNRISSFFGDELVMGSYMSRMLPLFLGLHLIKTKKNIYDNYLIGLIILFVGITILLSAERVAILFYILTIFFIFFFINQYKKIIIISSLFYLIFSFIIITNNPWAKERIFNKAIEIINVQNDERKYVFSHQHDVLFKTAFYMFKEKPLIGHGPRMFRKLNSDPKYFVDENSLHIHPHNFYFQLLAETGIIGFSFLTCLLFYVLISFSKQLKSIIMKRKNYYSDFQICLLVSIFLSVWPLSPNGNFFNNWLAIVYTFPAGFYLHSIYGKNKII